MWQRHFVSVSLVFVFVTCDNNMKIGPRKGKLFTFNTVNDDIRVDLDFSIPFISIPVKPTMENVFGSIGIPSVNVNLPALVLGGGVVLASTVLLPLVMKSFAQDPNYQRYAKILEHTHFGSDNVLDLATNVLSGGLQGCVLRVACWSGQHEQDEAVRIWTKMTSNQLVASMVNTTAVEDAITSGRRGRDCAGYSPCPLSVAHYPMLMRSLMHLTNANS